MKFMLVVLVAAALITACSVSAPGPEGDPPGRTRVDGDVFVVTKGGLNFKLGLVEISAVPKALIAPFVVSTLAGTKTDLVKMREDVDRDQSVERAQIGLLEVEDHLVQLTEGTLELAAQLRNPKEPGKALLDYKETVAHRDAKRLKLAELRKKINEEKRKIVELEKGCGFTRNLPSPTQIEKTDADGKFTLNLLAGTYAIVAASHRLVGSETENYCWLVWLNTAGEPTKRLMLSNDNLAETMCRDCVLPVQELASTMVVRPSTVKSTK
jgi:hypothetical protein